jgi:hypothetical protein
MDKSALTHELIRGIIKDYGENTAFIGIPGDRCRGIERTARAVFEWNGLKG